LIPPAANADTGSTDADVDQSVTAESSLQVERRLLRAKQAEEPVGGGIKAEGLSVVYRNGNLALSDATFSIPTSSICALVGINGSGKSTVKPFRETP